ncbi:MAG TPA: DoxX family protein [Azospirillaceae bacterium]|nr:DoxX family protein [Azospirillaceae bacterium]
MPRRLLFLEGVPRDGDLGLLLLRLVTGAFLIHGTQDNILSHERMQEFVGFLTQFGFMWPEVMAPLSVYAQFTCGVLMILGLLSRWAGAVIAFNFVVAVAMVHWSQDFRGWWPALVLVFIGLQLALGGAGRYSLDRRLAGA